MEGGVKYWTDYLKVYLAPQSLCLLPGLWQVCCTRISILCALAFQFCMRCW